MTNAVTSLANAVSEAIDQQLGNVDELALPRDVAIHRTAERLVREALVRGHAGDAEVGSVERFGAGNTAMLVASVQTSISFVVKVDTSKALLNEAHLLQRIAGDPSLPATTRRAFPRIFAIDDVGPLYGYLMEDLSEHEPLHLALRRGDPGSAVVVERLWDDVLAPAYRATARPRLAPQLWEDYFGRAELRILDAAARGNLPEACEPVTLALDGSALDLPGGWGPLLISARQRLQSVAPAFGTWVHGDPNPENALWSPGTDGRLRFRLLDPKDWWTGDYLFDVAKLGHYAGVTLAAEAGQVVVETACAADGWHFAVSRLPEYGLAVEAALLARVELLAIELSDKHWRMRYQFARAANLLSVAGGRASRPELSEAQLRLTHILFARGLAGLATVIGAHQ